MFACKYFYATNKEKLYSPFQELWSKKPASSIAIKFSFEKQALA